MTVFIVACGLLSGLYCAELNSLALDAALNRYTVTIPAQEPPDLGIYLDPKRGSNGNRGTQGCPVRTMAGALRIAAGRIGWVHLAEGDLIDEPLADEPPNCSIPMG